MLNERAVYKDVDGITRKQKVMVKHPEIIRESLLLLGLRGKGKRDCQGPGRLTAVGDSHLPGSHLWYLNGGAYSVST